MFAQIARLYDHARRRYPNTVFDMSGNTMTERGASSRSWEETAEIGPGNEQTTVAPAERGYDVTAVEVGVASLCS